MPETCVLQCGYCHSCTRKAARSVLFLPLHINFFHCVGAYLASTLHLDFDAPPPALRLVFSMVLIHDQVSHYAVLGRGRFHQVEHVLSWLARWMSRGATFSACSRAISSRIHTAEDGTASAAASAFPSRKWSRVASVVFTGATSGVGIDHGRGLSGGYLKTYCICSSFIIHYSALWWQSWLTSLCQPWWRYHFQRHWFSWTCTFGTSVVWPLAVERISRRHLFAVSSQSERKWWTHHCFFAPQSANDLQYYRLLSLQMQCLRWLILVPGFEWVHPAFNGVHGFVDIIFILIHAWHTCAACFQISIDLSFLGKFARSWRDRETANWPFSSRPLAWGCVCGNICLLSRYV